MDRSRIGVGRFGEGVGRERDKRRIGIGRFGEGVGEGKGQEKDREG